ncbi:uncharacterized protein LOC121971976 [Zingiber officinale]|uniref:CAAX prenyl protease 2/Lysostaphin resistance protein A-like domain-containing protein n=1 Tax=Zingiber officinale TaxID=94328 RepID=A0A8J5HFE5_ZINOF|nr:uncharacterized protein LOC121971976 [Zingiber officinale]KAG6516594.1 hypothetical protein ZIOFF_027063 [Zingiber officinale]
MLMACGISCSSYHLLFSSGDGRDLLASRKCSHSPFPGTKFLSTSICCGHGLQLKVFASGKSEKKFRKDGKSSKTFPIKELPLKELKRIPNEVPSDDKANFTSSTKVSADKYPSPSRRQVLQACIGTSCLLLALGAILRQLTHLASAEGWAVVNPSGLSFDFEMWHLELILALVILISSSRYILLKTWPDFSKSSEAANQQILSSLEPLDYVLVAFLPGISEEFLFRGALLPLFGLNWMSSLLVGAIFGVLHLGGGRRYSYAIWATFVGFAYGLAAIISSSIIVPMASHSLNNLVGGLLWRITSVSKKQDE